MNTTQPLFDPATRYRIEIKGRVDAEWLQRFDSSVEISVDEDRQSEAITVINVLTDQAGIVGLVRRLHGLGVVFVSVSQTAQ